jgi:hypothetical protein
VPPVLDPIGQLHVTRWQSDHFFDWPELHAHAMFWAEPVEKDVHDAVAWTRANVGWEVYAPVGGWVLPPQDEWRFTEEINPDIDDVVLAHAGDAVAVGEYVSAGLDATVFETLSLPVYDSLLEDGYLAEELQPRGEAMDIRIDGGDDIGAALLPDAVTVPEPIVVTSHNPASILPVRAGRDIVVTWEATPDPDDEVFILLDNRASGFLWNVGDRGSANVSDVLRAGNTELVSDAFLVMGRRKTSWAQLPEGRLQVRATTYQWLYLRTVRAYEIEPRIWPVGETTKVTFTAWDAAAGEVEISAGPGVQVANVRTIDRGAAQVVADVVVGPDAPTGPRDVRISVGGETVASARGGAWVAAPLEGAGDCESALDEEVTDGAWFATLDGLEDGVFDGSSCDIGNPGGAEQAIPVELSAGQTLHAQLLTDGFGATMYVASNCGGATISDCTDFPTFSFGADLRYTATQTESVVLVVDAFQSDTGRAQYAVDIRRTDPVALVIEPNSVPAGATTAMTVTGVGTEFGPDTAAVSFGDGITAEVLEIVDGVARVHVAVDVDASGLRALTATTVDGVVELEGALRVEPRLPQLTCEAAAQGEAIGAGVYVGSSASGNSTILVPDLCPDATIGDEVVHRVDLESGQTLQALVTDVEFDAVLYVLVDCDEEAVACSDFAVGPATEFLEWTAPADGATILLVVDGLDDVDQGEYTLHVRVLN